MPLSSSDSYTVVDSKHLALCSNTHYHALAQVMKSPQSHGPRGLNRTKAYSTPPIVTGTELSRTQGGLASVHGPLGSTHRKQGGMQGLAIKINSSSDEVLSKKWEDWGFFFGLFVFIK